MTLVVEGLLSNWLKPCPRPGFLQYIIFSTLLQYSITEDSLFKLLIGLDNTILFCSGCHEIGQTVLFHIPSTSHLWTDDLSFFLFEVKTSLGALSKNFVGFELDWRVTLGSVTLVRVKSARVTTIWISDRYMR